MSTADACPWSIGNDHFVMVTGHALLRNVARDWTRFTSAVPLRVPIPPDTGGRAVAQLPLESDPPDTLDYRRIVQGPFSRAAAADAEPTVAAMTEVLVDAALRRGELEVIDTFALPLFLRSLALVLGQPQSDATEWISWGRTVWEWSASRGEYLPNARMDAYIESRVDAAREHPGDDFYGLMARARFGDRPLTRDEMLGLANLTLAGGRDTTVAVIANALHHLAHHPTALERLAEEPHVIPTATEEFLRVYAPIHVLGRVATGPSEIDGLTVDAGSLVGLGYAVANRDPREFPDPDRLIIDRRPNRHVTFGHGPHTCLGAPLARMVISVVLRTIAARVATLEPTSDAVSKREIAPGVTVPVAPAHLVLRVAPREQGGPR